MTIYYFRADGTEQYCGKIYTGYVFGNNEDEAISNIKKDIDLYGEEDITLEKRNCLIINEI